jgi:hypothetical protein
MAEILIDRWRADTPGCVNVIHLNNAGAALMPQPVLRAIAQHLEGELVISVDGVVNPARLGHGEDTRDLGLRVGGVSWKGLLR